MAPDRRKDSYDLLALPLLWAPYALLTYRFNFLCDDAFITYRYARNWANGHGVRYNLGDHTPVEGYSNFLWVAICAAIDKIGANLLFWTPAISFVCGSVLLVMVYLVMRRRLELSLTVSCLATLLLGCSPAFAIWSTSGLETMPFSLLFFVTFYLLILKPNAAAPLMAAGFGIALSLMRVEGIYWALLFAPLMVVSRRLAGQEWRRSAVTYLLVLIAGYGAYWFWRYSYYQLPFSGSAYAKATFNWLVTKRGVKYVLVNWLTLVTPLLGYVGIAAALRKGRLAAGFAVVAIAVAVPCWAVVVGGDYMTMGRFLVPVLAFNVILSGWLIQDAWDGGLVRKLGGVVLAAALVIVGILPAWNVHLAPRDVIYSLTFRYRFYEKERTEFEQWRHQKGSAVIWSWMGITLKQYSEPGDTYVVDAIGARGYYSELFIYDCCGLVTPTVIEAQIWNLSTAGHERCSSSKIFFDKRPTYILTHAKTRGELRAAFEELKKKEYADRYVADFTPLVSPRPLGNLRYMVVVRIIEENDTAEAAWDRAFAKLERELSPEWGEGNK